MRNTFSGLILTALLLSPLAQADIVISEFNNTGLSYMYGDWLGTQSNTPTFFQLGFPATSRGGGGILLAMPQDFTSLGIDLTLRIGAGNEALNLLVILLDLADNHAAFDFNLSSFNTSTFTDVFLANPSYTVGPVNLSQIIRAEIRGDFSRDDALRLEIDRINARSPLIEPPPPAVPEPSTLGIAGLGLAGLFGLRAYRRQVRVRRER